jgi:hypothetical protein
MKKKNCTPCKKREEQLIGGRCSDRMKGGQTRENCIKQDLYPIVCVRVVKKTESTTGRYEDQWVDHDLSPEEETYGELYLNHTLTVAPERQMLQLTMVLPKLMDYEEMKMIKVTHTRKKTIKEQQGERGKKKEKFVVKEHCTDTTTKKLSKWTTCKKGRKAPK